MSEVATILKLGTRQDFSNNPSLKSRKLVHAATKVLSLDFLRSREGARSPGSFMVLDHIEQARTRSLPYLYLGYWIEGCRKMTYKARFEPLEARTPQGWVPLKRP